MVSLGAYKVAAFGTLTGKATYVCIHVTMRCDRITTVAVEKQALLTYLLTHSLGQTPS